MTRSPRARNRRAIIFGRSRFETSRQTIRGKTIRSSRNTRRSFLHSIARSGLVLGAEQVLGPILPVEAETKPIAPWDVHLIDVARQAGLNSRCVFGRDDTKQWILETTGCGIAFFDYDHDGWLDIFQVNGTTLEGFPKGQEPTNHLYHNNRDGTFTDVTVKAGLARPGWGQGVCIGDYDNDGRDDLFVTYWGQNVLYRNNGDGTFTDVTEKAGLLQQGPRPRWNTGCCFVDYDKDGRLDLFVANYVDFDLAHAPRPGEGTHCRWKGVAVNCGPLGLPTSTNILYHNNGDGTFTDVSEKSGILRTPGHYCFTAAAADFDNDGWPDIYVACDSAPAILYRNRRDGTFTDVGIASGCAFNEDGQAQAGMGVAVGDYDGDGWLDIFKTNFSDDTSTLYRNNRDGTFTDATFESGLGLNKRYLGWGCGFVDLDNDGWPDVFLANGHVYPEIERAGLTPYHEPKILYHSLGNGRFEDVSQRSGPGVQIAASARGVAFGDYDNDGGVEILINNMNDAPTLLRRDAASHPTDAAKHNRWLAVKAIGTRSNRSGIGARVRVTAGGRAQVREVASGGSYTSQSDLRLHFGLGAAAKADAIEVRWPSGQVDTLKNVDANQVIVVKEGLGLMKG